MLFYLPSDEGYKTQSTTSITTKSCSLSIWCVYIIVYYMGIFKPIQSAINIDIFTNSLIDLTEKDFILIVIPFVS